MGQHNRDGITPNEMIRSLVINVNMISRFEISGEIRHRARKDLQQFQVASDKHVALSINFEADLFAWKRRQEDFMDTTRVGRRIVCDFTIDLASTLFEAESEGGPLNFISRKLDLIKVPKVINGFHVIRLSIICWPN
jgi:hypothetical protein